MASGSDFSESWESTKRGPPRAIYRSFTGEEAVARLTVEEAYARRRQTDKIRSDANSPQQRDALRRAVGQISRRADAVIDDAAFSAPDEAAVLIPAVRKAIKQLEDLLRHLERQASSGHWHSRLTAGSGLRMQP